LGEFLTPEQIKRDGFSNKKGLRKIRSSTQNRVCQGGVFNKKQGLPEAGNPINGYKAKYQYAAINIHW
jgi:hypothetical protein